MYKKDLAYDLYNGVMESRMSDEEKEYYKELDEYNSKLWDTSDKWIDLESDESIPTFNCIILLRDYENEKFLLARYEFEPPSQPPFGYDDVWDDDSDLHFYNIETGKEYDSHEIYGTYSHMMVIKRLDNERKETEEV